MCFISHWYHIYGFYFIYFWFVSIDYYCKITRTGIRCLFFREQQLSGLFNNQNFQKMFAFLFYLWQRVPILDPSVGPFFNRVLLFEEFTFRSVRLSAVAGDARRDDGSLRRTGHANGSSGSGYTGNQGLRWWRPFQAQTAPGIAPDEEEETCWESSILRL